MTMDLSWITTARDQIAAKRAQLDQVEASLETAARILGAPAFAPSASPVAAVPAPKRRTSVAAAPAGDADAKVLAFFEKQKAPIGPGVAQEKLGLGAYGFRLAVARLLEAKQLVRRGVTNNVRIGTPDVMAAADQEGD